MWLTCQVAFLATAHGPQRLDCLSANCQECPVCFDHVLLLLSCHGRIPHCLQVPWHAVLGNHDYGECWTTGSCEVAKARCQQISPNSDCYLSPLHQVQRLLPGVLATAQE